MRRHRPRGVILMDAMVGLAIVIALPALYTGSEYVNAFPDDYEFLYGEDRPFAPSLASTATGGASPMSRPS